MPLIHPGRRAISRGEINPSYLELWRGLVSGYVWQDEVNTPDLKGLHALSPTGGTLRLGNLGIGHRIGGTNRLQITDDLANAIADAGTIVGVFTNDDNTTGDGTLVDTKSGTNDGWDFDIASNVPTLVVDTGTEVTATGPSIPSEDGKTYVMVGTYDGSEIRVWVNGVPGTAQAQSGTASLSASEPYIGNDAFRSDPFQRTTHAVYFYDRALTPDEIRLITLDPFGLIRPFESVVAFESVSLFATADGTIIDVVNQDDALPIWSNIDDDPDTPTDSDWANNAIDLSGGDASGFFDVTDMPGDFGNAEAASGVVRVQGQDVTGTLKLYVQLFQSDESTTLSDEVEAVAISTDGTWTNYAFTITGINTSAGKSVWDAARARFRWSIT